MTASKALAPRPKPVLMPASRPTRRRG